MKKIIFKRIPEYGDKINEPSSNDYMLLSHFLDDFEKYSEDLKNETIKSFESILSGEKTFEEITDINLKNRTLI